MGNAVPNWSKSSGVPEYLSQKKSVFDFTVKTINGENVSLAKYRNFSALLVVNVASKCGLTQQHYTELVEIHNIIKEKYMSSDKQFEILAFPCGQFANQEFKTAEEIIQFVEKYNLNFPLFEKIMVNGPDTSPLFQYLKLHTPDFRQTGRNSIMLKPIGWNFGKFLIDSEGHVVTYFGPKTPPKKCLDDIIKVMDGELKGTVFELPAGGRIYEGEASHMESCSKK